MSEQIIFQTPNAVLTDRRVFFFGQKSEDKAFPYYCFSNFAPARFEDDDGRKFFNAEQAFTFYKALTFEPNNTELLEGILEESDPKKMRELGRKIQNFDIEIWNSLKQDYMRMIQEYKYIQNPNLLQILLSSEGLDIFEANPHDGEWGIKLSASVAIVTDPSHYGTNFLGKILQNLRDSVIATRNKVALDERCI